MKLRQAQQRLQNLKDLKETNRGSNHESFMKSDGPTSSGFGGSDSRQSGGTQDHGSGIKEGEVDASNLLRKENQMQEFVESQGNSPETSQKISLVPDSVAGDAVGELRPSNDADLETRSGSPLEPPAGSLEESESSLDFSVRSGPSSPSEAVLTDRCGECQSLYEKMRRRPPPKTQNSNNTNPASLSCDQWVLLKKRCPQRDHRTEKRLLWTSLIQITQLAAQVSRNRAENICSRPHVFQQRNLRRCKFLTSVQTDLSFTTAKPRHRRRQRPALWPPIGGQKPVKRKPSLNKTLSQQISSFNPGVSYTQKSDGISGLDASSTQNSSVSPKLTRKNIQERSNKQEVCGGVETTRRALTFEDAPKIVAKDTAKRSRGPWRRLEGGKICEDQKVVETKDLWETFEGTDGFKTPTDLFILKRKMKRGNEEVQTSGDTRSAVQTTNFMSVLASAVRNHNKITKETCQ